MWRWVLLLLWLTGVAAAKALWSHDLSPSPAPPTPPPAVLCLSQGGGQLCPASVGCCEGRCCSPPTVPPSLNSFHHFETPQWVQVIGGILVSLVVITMIAICFSRIIRARREAEDPPPPLPPPRWPAAAPRPVLLLLAPPGGAWGQTAAPAHRATPPSYEDPPPPYHSVVPKPSAEKPS